MRSRVRALIVASLLAIGLALVLAGPAAAIHRDFRLGAFESIVDQDDLAEMKDAGVRNLGITFNWARIEQQRSTPAGACNAVYDFRGYDELVKLASAHGYTVLPVIAGSPPYAATPAESNPPHSRDTAFQDYKCFVRALVDQYRPGGVLHTVNPTIAPITSWQVWLEPNLKFASANRTPDPREYARLFTATQEIIQSRDPGAQMVLAGMPEQGSSGSITIHSFLRSLYGISGFSSRFDLVALHPYAEGEPGVEGALIRLRDTLRRVGDRRQYVWITEVGFASDGDPNAFPVSSPTGQARKLDKTLGMMRDKRDTYRIGTVDVFRWRDQADPEQSFTWQDYSGLYSKGGDPKPACSSFVKYTGGRCERIGGNQVVLPQSNALEETPPQQLEPSPAE